MAREPAREPHPFAVDVGAGILEEHERFRVVAKVVPISSRIVSAFSSISASPSSVSSPTEGMSRVM